MIGKFSCLYGPVPSRRLGMSLGVELVPHKVCIYDCVFCEVGPTKRRVISRKEYVRKDRILRELDIFLSSYGGRIDHITLTGSGETTLNSKLGDIIAEIKSRFDIPVAVLTHSGNIHDERVREELAKADVICPSLDSVSQKVFEKVNRPHHSVRIEKVIEGLMKLRESFRNKLLLEVLLVKGINDSDDEISKIGEVSRAIKPDMVQISTVDRPGAYPSALPLSSDELHKAKEMVSKYYSRVEVISRHYRNPEPPEAKKVDLREDILDILRRRPLTVMDIVVSEGVEFFEVKRVIEDLLRCGEIEEVVLNGTKFYRPTTTRAS